MQSFQNGTTKKVVFNTTFSPLTFNLAARLPVQSECTGSLVASQLGYPWVSGTPTTAPLCIAGSCQFGSASLLLWATISVLRQFF